MIIFFDSINMGIDDAVKILFFIVSWIAAIEIIDKVKNKRNKTQKNWDKINKKKRG